MVERSLSMREVRGSIPLFSSHRLIAPFSQPFLWAEWQHWALGNSKSGLGKCVLCSTGEGAVVNFACKQYTCFFRVIYIYIYFSP